MHCSVYGSGGKHGAEDGITSDSFDAADGITRIEIFNVDFDTLLFAVAVYLSFKEGTDIVVQFVS